MEKTIAIVTGASGGLGSEFVKIFQQDDRIEEIWAIARDMEKLEKLAQGHPEKLRLLSKDLTDRNQVASLGKMIQEEAVNILYLVNNAGYAKFCSYDDLSIEQSLNMIDLNIGAVVALGLYSIPQMKPGSHIINIASQASFQPLPFQNIYSSTKSFVRNYTRALHVELREKQITATAVCPGWIRTGLYKRGLIGAKKGTNIFRGMVLPEKVAQKAVKDANKGKDMSIYSMYVKLGHVIAKLLPQKGMIAIWLKQQKL